MVRRLKGFGVDVQHHRAIMRGLVTALFEHEAITTTHAKAKRTQMSAERIIALARRKVPNEEAAKGRIQRFIYKPKLIIPKLFGEFAERYKNFSGGFTRVLKLEPRLGDNAPLSIVELIGGKRDMRRALTARIVARHEQQSLPIHPLTQKEIDAISRRGGPEAEKEFRELVEKMKTKFYSNSASLKGLPRMHEPRKRAPIKIVENPLAKKSVNAEK